ncbi:MAG: 2-oxoacid:acceptor oxidoreductase family protein, partial [Candidatus Thorarchaeota archaeon]
RPVVGDTFGASRRGGSVMTHIRIGNQDWGPLIPRGEADVLLGFEPVETLRAAVRYASKKTVAVVSKKPILPSNVTSGDLRYPKIEDIVEELKAICGKVYLLDAEPVLEELGSTRALNSFMLGALSTIQSSPLDAENLEKALSGILKSEKDNSAFHEGRKAMK